MSVSDPIGIVYQKKKLIRLTLDEYLVGQGEGVCNILYKKII